MSTLPASVLHWAAHAVGNSARVVGVEELRPNPRDRGPWLLHVDQGGAIVEVVVKTGPTDPAANRGTTTILSVRSSLASEAAALEFVEQYDVPAPRLLAVDLDGDCGRLALLTSAAPGSSGVPDPAALRTLGAAAARLAAIPLAPSTGMAPCTRPRQADDYIALRQEAAQRRARYLAGSNATQDAIVDQYLQRRPSLIAERARDAIEAAATTPLIETAERCLRELPEPSRESVLVHDDLCGGNTVWSGSDQVTIIDWEGAGLGHPTLDLANARFEESMHFGMAGAAEILRGWQEAMGRQPESLAYWDLVAALNTPADLYGWTMTPGMTERRDAFLRAVLADLG